MKNNQTDDPVRENNIVVNSKESHIQIKRDLSCRKKCDDKPCTHFCPSQVFHWQNEAIEVRYWRCLECGACLVGCPYQNIALKYPEPPYGIQYRY